MITNTPLQWITTLLFGFCAVYCVGLLRSHRRVTHVIDHTAHLLMAVFMIAMVWPWGLIVPLAPQAVIFLAATGWFVVTAGLTRRPPFADTGGPHHGAGARSYHAVMMASMVWMIVVMAGWVGNKGHSSMAGDNEHMPGMDMAGMDMPSSSPTAWWVDATTVSTIVVFVVAAVFWLHRAFVEEQSSSLVQDVPNGSTVTAMRTSVGVSSKTLAAASEVAMAAGMAIMMTSLL